MVTSGCGPETGKKVLTMAEYVTKEQVIDWYRSYGQTDEPIPFETLVSDLRDMKAADVAPVRHGKWLCVDTDTEQFFLCNRCKKKEYWESDYCPNCGCKMDLEG